MGILGIIAKKAPGGIMKVVKKLGKKILKKQAKQATIKGAIKVNKTLAKAAANKASTAGMTRVNKTLAKAAANKASTAGMTKRIAAAEVAGAKAILKMRQEAVRGINPNAIIPMPTIVKNTKPVAKKAVKTLNKKVITGLKVLGGLTTAGGIAGLIGKKKKKKK